MAILHPLECFLLEKFSSAEHFAATRDAIINWIDAHEAAYVRVQSELNLRQRKKPQWQQGDVVWGSKVLPNIRPSRDFYIKAYIMRVNNDPLAFKAGCAMDYNNRGISECWIGWMRDDEKRLISTTQYLATELDSRLGATVNGGWDEGHLTYNGQGSLYQLNELPKRIPRYELNLNVRIEKDEQVKQIGIYLPDVDTAPAHFLFPNLWQDGRPVRRGTKRNAWVDPDSGKREYDWEEDEMVETGWTLIRRVEDEYIEVPERGFFPEGKPDELYTWPEREAQFVVRDEVAISVKSGERATHTGKWSKFVRPGFAYLDEQEGDLMPFHDEHKVTWTLIARADGGDCFIPRGKA